MRAATVLIPTHNHVEPLRLSIKSAQNQTVRDIEIFVVGDGVGDATRAVIAELAASDPRIRFFDFPKGPRKGEVHRHYALQHATGRIVAYLGDDDYWMPKHVETLSAALSDADFAHTMHVGVDAAGSLFALPADLENPGIRTLMLNELYNCFDFTFAGHTLAAYRRLPYGWQTTPPEFPWTDLYMWRQFLAEPWCRARSAMVPTCICTQSHLRPHLTDIERAEDLAHWQNEAMKPGFGETPLGIAVQAFGRQAAQNQVTAHQLNHTEQHLKQIEASASWRITGPLRSAKHFLMSRR